MAKIGYWYPVENEVGGESVNLNRHVVDGEMFIQVLDETLSQVGRTYYYVTEEGETIIKWEPQNDENEWLEYIIPIEEYEPALQLRCNARMNLSHESRLWFYYTEDEA